jgi:hypothetical protein
MLIAARDSGCCAIFHFSIPTPYEYQRSVRCRGGSRKPTSRQLLSATFSLPPYRHSISTAACPHCKRVQRHGIESAVTEAWIAPKQTSPPSFDEN